MFDVGAGFVFKFARQVAITVADQRGERGSVDFVRDVHGNVIDARLDGAGNFRLPFQVVYSLDEIVVKMVVEVGQLICRFAGINLLQIGVVERVGGGGGHSPADGGPAGEGQKGGTAIFEPLQLVWKVRLDAVAGICGPRLGLLVVKAPFLDNLHQSGFHLVHAQMAGIGFQHLFDRRGFYGMLFAALLHFDVKVGEGDFLPGQAIVEHCHILIKYVYRHHWNRVQRLDELVLCMDGKLVVV